MSAGNQINHDTGEPSGFWISFTIGAIAISLILIFIWCIYFYRVTKSEEFLRKQDMFKSKSLNSQRLYEKEHLSRLEWKNKSENKLYLPIDLAMEKTVKQYR